MQDKVYELRFYTFNIEGKADFKRLNSDPEFWKLRTDIAPVPGIWETQLHGATEFFHVAQYGKKLVLPFVTKTEHKVLPLHIMPLFDNHFSLVFLS